jgi:predicted RNase H-like nuclease (RuvC/YqgF family)
MATSLREIQRLQEEITQLQKELSEAEGGLAAIKAQMKEEFGVSTSAEAKEEIAKLEKAVAEAERKAQEKVDEAKALIADMKGNNL